MLTESKFRSQLAGVWRSIGSPIRKAKAFLRISSRAGTLAKQLMELGFIKHREGEHARSRVFWFAAASMFELSKDARENARSALAGGSGPKGFGYAPRKSAVPSWDRTNSGPEPEGEADGRDAAMV